MTIDLVIPAAGLGTRLAPLTDDTPKEMLPLGGRPLLHGALLEAAAAGIRDLIVVLAPGKEALREWVAEHTAIPVGFALQPSPAGVLDAIARGRALLGPGAFAVLYPDWLTLPDQTGLAAIVAAHERFGGGVFGLVRRSALHGPTAHAFVGDVRGDVRRIERLEAGEGAIHTAFAEIRAEGMRLPEDDRENLDAWNEVARAGALRGVLLGEALDVGHRPGYDDAVARFVDGRAHWRDP